MGQEVQTDHFRQHHFHAFEQRHKIEMEHLRALFASDGFSSKAEICGLELEAWIVSPEGRPLPINDTLLERLDNPAVVPELSRFNIEFNAEPQPLAGAGLANLCEELALHWQQAGQAARELDASLVAIGILPTIEDEHLTLKNMSAQKRYKALNEQVLRLRQGRPLRLDIRGHSDHLLTEHTDVMLEAAATSLQLHLQVPAKRAHHYYNAALVLAAPTIAIAANAPFLFGKNLWDETRIPVFEQAVAMSGEMPRVHFGTSYARESLEELFVANFEQYPVLLPMAQDAPAERLAHVRLHNGTIWRWVRPLIGFDPDGTPHLRIEHRVFSAGPTMADMAANTSFFYGLVHALVEMDTELETQLPFENAATNFYEAARYGLLGSVRWLDGQQWKLGDLIQHQLLPLAERGLEQLGVDANIIERDLAILSSRVTSGQNGAVWQRQFIAKHGPDRLALTCAYRERQLSGEPVHRWTV